MSVRLENVTVRYGEHVAVADVTVEFPRGAIGLLGRNGAGKSSILKALLGLIQPTAGRMLFADLPADASQTAIRAHVGYMPERDAHLPEATGFDMVSLLGMLNGMPRRAAYCRAHEVLYLVGLEEQRYRPVASYSAGMRQKAKLAAALVHDPKVLFLDEPTNGLDPAGRADMLRLVRQLSRDYGKSVVFSTHILPDVESVCEAAVVMEKGRVVAAGSLQQLTRGGERQHTVAVEPDSAAVAAALQALGRLHPDGAGRYHIWLPNDAPPACIFAAVAGSGAVVRSLVPHRRSLEDVFLQAVGFAQEGQQAQASPAEPVPNAQPRPREGAP